MIPLPQFADRHVAVFGLARSGLSAARALSAAGARVRAWDDSAERRAAAAAAGVMLADPAGGDWAVSESLVLSPGVPLTHPAPHPVVLRARACGTEVIGDIELLLRAGLPSRRVMVTGTNGKSTTTALLGHLLQAAGRSVAVGGNLGTPVLDLPALGAEGIYVLEMSSYQIDLTPSLVCDVAVLLNISPDHLDRHGSMAGYVAVKRRLAAGTRSGGTAVIGIDDAHCAGIQGELAASGQVRPVPVAIGRRLAGGVSVVDGLLRADPEGVEIDLKRCPALPGSHNWQNAAAAFAAARALGLEHSDIEAGMRSFPGLAHRMERVAEIGGIAFVNDSKATNADAAARALACYDDIYWIAGGQPKAGGIAPLADYFPRIAHAFLIGEAAEGFAATLAGRVPTTLSGTLSRAVAEAHALALAEGRAGAVVLLSPACASFDQFRDFEARGEAFRRSVALLSEGAA